MPHRTPLPPSLRHGYGVAGLSFSIVDTSMRIFLFKFLVDEAQLAPVIAGTVLLVGKIWDAINDPLVGRLSDRTKTRMGARRPWVAGGLAPFLVCFATLWSELPWSGVWRAGGYAVLLLFFDTFLTALGIPYSALSQSLTNSYDERARLNASRVGWGMIGALLAGAGMPFLAERTGSWAQAGMIFTVIVAIPLLIMLRATRGYDVAAAAYSEEPVWSILQNRAFRRVVFLSVTSWPCLAVASALLPFYCQHHLGHPERLKIYLGTGQLSALLGWILAFVALALMPRDGGAGRGRHESRRCLLWGHQLPHQARHLAGALALLPGARNSRLRRGSPAPTGVGACHPAHHLGTGPGDDPLRFAAFRLVLSPHHP